MKLNDLKKRLFNIAGADKRTKFIFIIGIAGILLICLSELLPEKSTKQVKAVSDDPVTEDTYTYKCQIEQELIEMLEQIQGVGKVSAMVTIEGTTEYVYAEELNTVTDKDDGQLSERYENQIVMTEENGVKKALVRQIIKPKISGVVIVCEGGGNLALNERVIKAVSTALNLPTSKICVECRK